MRKGIPFLLLVVLLAGFLSIQKVLAEDNDLHTHSTFPTASKVLNERADEFGSTSGEDLKSMLAGILYYVDRSASSNCRDDPAYGSESNPWCTISYAVSRISAGDTVYVKSGTYNENLTISGLVGTAEEMTNILAYPGHDVTLQGNGINTGRIKITASSYLSFDGFKITNYNQGFFIEGNSDHITIRNCVIYSIGQEGIHVKENSSYITLDRNLIYDTDLYIYNGEGIYIGTGSGGPHDNTHHVTVSGNIIHDVGDEAIELKPGTHDCIVEGNTVYNAITGQTWGAIEVSEAILGAQEWASNPNHIIRNNIIHDVVTGIRAGTGSLVYNNVIYDIDAYGIYINNRADDSYLRAIYHNTIDASSTNAIYTAAGLTDIKNNIGPSTTHNIPANSSFFLNTSEDEEDYHLVNGATPIDTGVDLTNVVATDIEGTIRPYSIAPDMGAYEYTPEAPIMGDVNGDGQVDFEDVQASVNHSLGIQGWGTTADVNEDGAVNILDVQRIINIISNQ
jgi:hypothetical protein